MRLLKLSGLLVFALMLFGIPLVGLFGSADDTGDTDAVTFGPEFLLPQTDDRSQRVKTWYQGRTIGAAMISLRNATDARVLSSVDTSRVVSGKTPGWFFYKEQFARCPRPRDIDDAIDRAAAIRDVFAAAEIGIVITISPDKASLYPEHVPTRADEDGCFSQASAYLRSRSAESDGVVVDLHPAMLDAKQHGEVYFPGDTHWTPYGFKVSLEHVLRTVFDKPGLSGRQISSRFGSDGEGRNSDLSRMLRIGQLDRERTVDFRSKTYTSEALGIDGQFLVMHDSFFGMFRNELREVFPDARFVHLTNQFQTGKLDEDDLALPPGSFVLINSVQRGFPSRFRLRPSGSVQDALMTLALEKNAAQLGRCEFAQATPQTVRVKTKQSNVQAGPDVDHTLIPTSQLFLSIPELAGRPDPVCIRLSYLSDSAPADNGALFLQHANGDLTQGYLVPLNPVRKGSRHEVVIALPSKMMGRTLRYDPRLDGVTLRDVRLEVAPMASRTSG